MGQQNPIIHALNVQTVGEARRLVDTLHDVVFGFKPGIDFITAMAVLAVADDAVHQVVELRQFYKETAGRLMWDGKWNDIPTVAGGAAQSVGPINPWACTFHSLSGKDAVRSVLDNLKSTLGLGVTLLTSIDNPECFHWFGFPAEELVLTLAGDLADAQAPGLVCSPMELAALNRDPKFTNLMRIVPGVRSDGADQGDQARVLTPKAAIAAGATKIVVGRQIATAKSPRDEAKKILAEIFG